MLCKYLALWALATAFAARNQSAAVQCKETLVGDQAAPRLPPIWDSSYDDYYHLLGEIRLPEARASFLSEEWASSELASFRWDLSPTDLGSKRKTILVNDKSNERFHFEPFNCQPIGNLSSALSQKLADLFPADEHKFVIGGLGAIWLRAFNANKQLFRSAKQRHLSASSGATSSMPLGYDEILVEADAKFPYSIAVYFHEGHLGRPIPLGGANLSFRQKSAVALVLADPKRDHRPVLSARIIEFWHSEDPTYKSSQQAAVFELPAGYGCARAQFKLNQASESLYAPPANCFRRDGRPHGFDLQVSALLPSQTEHDLDKWAAHSSSVRVLRGELAGRRYAVVKRQDFAPATSRTTPNGTSRPLLVTRERAPRRIKRVWELGRRPAGGEPPAAETGAGGGFHFAGQRQRQQQPDGQVGPMFYELDEQRRACARFETARAADEAAHVATVEFPVLTDEGQRVEAGLALTEELLGELFESTANYQPICESKDYWLSARRVVHERRQDLFELHDKRGQRVWLGPVSIVRQFMAPNANFEHIWRAKRPDDLQVRVDLRMYSAHYAQLVGRVRLVLSPGQLLDVAQFHRELNIEPCLELAAPSAGSTLHSSQGLEFQLNYVVADAPASLFGELAANGRLEELVYAQFIENVARLGAGQAAGEPLVDPLQVSAIRVDIDRRERTVSITGRVHEWPHLFNFDRKAALRFADGSPAAKRLLVTLAGKANAELCAESCAHYACHTFSYCQDSNQCQIVVPPGDGGDDDDQTSESAEQQQQQRGLSFEADESCAIYAKRADRSARRPMSPAEFVHLHERLISTASFADKETVCPLLMEFHVEVDKLEAKTRGSVAPISPATTQAPGPEKRTIQLIPSSIVAPIGRRAAQLDFVPVGWLPNNSPNLDYQLLFDRKRFKPIRRLDEQTFPLPEANHVVSYEDCETLCRQNDCRSFSYCRLERTCTVSRLHKSELIEASAEPADSCRLLALDYLSKFSQAQADTGLASTRSIPATRRTSSGSRRDCAISCMEEARFKCRSFAYCRPVSPASGTDAAAAAEPNCLLRRSHSTSALQERQIDQASPGGASSDQFSCQMYIRSHLADFDRFYGHRLAVEPADQRVSLLNLGATIDAELCAAKCADSEGSTDASRCRAFHVCRSDRRLTCATMVETAATPITTTPTSNSTRKLSDYLVAADGCTAFLLTRNAPSTGNNGDSNADADDDADEQQADDVSRGDSGSVAGRLGQCLLVVLGGLAIGYSTSWLISAKMGRRVN